MKILPPSRPKRDDAVLDRILDRYEINRNHTSIILIRGYYLDSMGKPGIDDVNIYDDAAFLITPDARESFNANTEPSFPLKGYATLKLGMYTFYPSFHHVADPKKRYKALRPYPEGVVLQCTRNGQPSTCGNTNLHMGGANPGSFDVVWSQGCITIPKTQYPDWLERTWPAIEKYNADFCGSSTVSGKSSPLVEVVIVENRIVEGKQQLVDHAGKVI